MGSCPLLGKCRTIKVGGELWARHRRNKQGHTERFPQVTTLPLPYEVAKVPPQIKRRGTPH